MSNDRQILIESIPELRNWLAANHDTTGSVWLVRWTKASGRPVLSLSDIVDELLCFGWIDSVSRRLDGHRTMLRISPRKPSSNWSRINKAKVERLTRAGRMTPAGKRSVELAKRRGTWSFLDDVDALIEPEDLRSALDATPEARRNFDRFPPSSRRGILEWIKTAKTAPTRVKRIRLTAERAAQNRKANFPAGRDRGPTVR